MKDNEDKITEAIDLYFSNLSSRKVRNHFRRHRPKNASHVTVLDWCRKYVLKVTKYIDNLQPQLSGKYYMDEIEIDCSGRNDFFWVAVDWDTRFIPNTHYSLFWDTNNCKEFLRKIKRKKGSDAYRSELDAATRSHAALLEKAVEYAGESINLQRKPTLKGFINYVGLNNT